jgi:hypothetical protein
MIIVSSNYYMWYDGNDDGNNDDDDAVRNLTKKSQAFDDELASFTSHHGTTPSYQHPYPLIPTHTHS